jgi:alpha-methylacyl-CoA racemase
MSRSDSRPGGASGSPEPSPRGPLEGLRVIELAGLGPGPFCAMLLADMGADVLRIQRPAHRAGKPIASTGNLEPDMDVVVRGRQIAELDLKSSVDTDRLLELCSHAAVLMEGFRPGVMERLGLGPAQVLSRNPSLVYARLTGYGQSGPLAHTAGHDINYLAISGVLSLIAREGERPLAPLNLLGDFGGGGMLAAVGILSAVYARQHTGSGQVVDAAMLDGVALLAAKVHGLRTTGTWSDRAGTNFLDSGAPFYDTYETADGRYMAVGALEEPFYEQLMKILEIPEHLRTPQTDREHWPELRQTMADIFLSRTLEEWSRVFQDVDACVTPVLSLDEAAVHHHNAARGVYQSEPGLLQPGRAPRFSRTPSAPRREVSVRLDADGVNELLRRWQEPP